ncbi:hypothetical protein ACFVVL_10715 [Kitasatospora sp. NPDC058115]|uniref:hypothetical protein n=1 Tax=Kitasatospora sp. NPDC058115 TaxID=3346347 RepID=UPI0036D98D1F
MDLETMPRRSGRARATALAGLALAVVTVLAGCGGGAAADSDAAPSGPERAPASASAAPDPAATTSTSAPAPTSVPSAPADPSAPAPVTTPPADPSATAPDPRPAATGPALTPTPAPTPPGAGGNGIAVGEPAPNGPGNGSPVHPAVTYRVDGTRLTVWFYGGVCQRYALKADESKPGRVDIRVTTAAPVPAGQDCVALAQRQTVAADLKEPLRGRTVTDAATGQEVPLEADPKIGPDPAAPDVPGAP